LKAAFPDHNTIFASQSEFDLPFSELKKRGRKVMLLYGNEEVVRNQQSGMNLLSPDEVRTDEAKHNTLAYQSRYSRNTSVASFLLTFPALSIAVAIRRLVQPDVRQGIGSSYQQRQALH
jgi:hypothetical protein